jgi:hypothetical protein
MASRTQITLVDDLDGSEAQETVSLGLDGVTYELDLNDEHAKQLREALAPYLEAGRRVGGGARRGPAKKAAAAPSSKVDTTAVREWAKKEGIEVSDRGRLSNDLLVKFQEATGQ